MNKFILVFVAFLKLSKIDVDKRKISKRLKNLEVQTNMGENPGEWARNRKETDVWRWRKESQNEGEIRATNRSDERDTYAVYIPPP